MERRSCVCFFCFYFLFYGCECCCAVKLRVKSRDAREEVALARAAVWVGRGVVRRIKCWSGCNHGDYTNEVRVQSENHELCK